MRPFARPGASFCGLVLLCAMTAQLKAEDAFSLESTPGELPKAVVPRHYVIRLGPDEKRMVSKGVEAIEIEVLKPVNQIRINAVNTKIWNATLARSETRENLVPQPDAATEQVKFTTAQDLKPGIYTLSFCFESQINTDPYGLFIQHYRDNGKPETLLATKMMPTGARRIFPCWDEPAFRATFQLSVETDKKSCAISNMPDVSEQALGNDKKLVIFGQSPPLASYLVSLVCGHLESVEDQADGVKLRVFAAPGKAKLAKFALESSKKILSYYRTYFDVSYPSTKLDQIALPENFGDATSGWGAIIYNEDLLLYDPINSPPQVQERLFAAIAREIGQQWLGNLVTIAWWNDLWLSESFASWMGRKAEENLHSEWRGWVEATTDRELTMARDARSDVLPIQRTIGPGSEMNEQISDLTFCKGQCVIRMLEGFLGEETFQNGIRLYVKQNQFSNVTAANLWQALERTSGRPVSEMASSWMCQPGIPLIRVTAECVSPKQVVTLEQSRFTLDPAVTNNQQWTIPVGLLSTFDPRPVYALLDKISETVDFPDCAGALNVNANALGYYRVWYEPDLLTKLLGEWDRLSDEERVNVVSDAWAMAITDRSPVTTYLDLLERLGNETSYNVWHTILQNLLTIDRLEQGQPGRENFQAYACTLLSPRLERLGWYPALDEELAAKQFRADLIKMLGMWGDRSVINAAFERFELMLKDPHNLTADTREAVSWVVGHYSSADVYDDLNQLARNANFLEIKNEFYHALESALDPKLAARTLDLVIGEEISPAESGAAFSEIASNGEHAALAWSFVKSRLDQLEKERSQALWTDIVPAIARAMRDPAAAREVIQVAKDHAQKPGFAETKAAVDSVELRAKLQARLLPDIDEWVRKRLEGRLETTVNGPGGDSR